MLRLRPGVLAAGAVTGILRDTPDMISLASSPPRLSCDRIMPEQAFDYATPLPLVPTMLELPCPI